MRFFLFLTLLSVGVAVSGYTQVSVLQAQIQTEDFSLRHGLSHQFVTSLVKDSRGFLWVGTENGISRFDGYGFVSYNKEADGPNHISAAMVHALRPCPTSELLLYTDSAAQHEVFNTATGGSTVLPPGDYTGYKGYYRGSYTQGGNVYMAAREGDKDVVYRYISGKGKYQLAMPGFSREPSGLYEYFEFIRDEDNTYWFGYMTDAGLQVYHLTTEGKIINKYGASSFLPLPTGNALPTGIGLGLLQSKNGKIFISVSGQGVYWYDKASDAFKILPLPSGAVFSLTEDTLGNVLAYDKGIGAGRKTVWLIRPSLQVVDYSAVANHMSIINVAYSDDFESWLLLGGNDGIKKVWLKPTLFTNFFPSKLGNLPGISSMRGISPDGTGNILFATETSGIHALARNGQLARLGEGIPGLKGLGNLEYVRNLLLCGDSMLLIAHARGLTAYFPRQKRIEEYNTLKDIRAMAAGQNGLVWMAGSDRRLFSFNLRNKKLEQYLEKGGVNPLAGYDTDFLLCDKKNSLWAGTSKGLVRIELNKGSSRFCNILAGGGEIAVSCITEGANGMLWLGTLGRGLHLFNPATEKVMAVYGKKEGLANESVAGIVADGKGNLWVSTYCGLAFFNRASNTFVIFYDKDGLPSNEFNRHSFFRDTTTGAFYFGGMNGITTFYGKNTIKPALDIPVLVAQASYMQDGKRQINKQLGVVDGATIELSAVSRWLNLQLALPSYGNPEGNQFSYKVEGLDNEWQHMGNDRVINFTYLPAGTYTLRLRGTTSHRGWPQKEYSIHLIVHDFWYNQWWFRLLVVVLSAAGTYFYCRLLFKKHLSAKEAKRLGELDAFKTRFFTNITHEFRTPLTIILASANQLEDEFAKTDTTLAKNANRRIGLIRRGGENLLRMVSQILDLSRLENSSLPMHYIHGDIAAYIRYIAGNHLAITEAHGIHMEVKSSPDNIFIDYDPERIQQIVHNLIANAIKFTPAEGSIVISVSREGNSSVSISVADTGSGIPQEDLPYIFERFYQAKNQTAASAGGTGIGLSFIKELLKAMGGAISVSSNVDKGTVFTVLLPVLSNAGLPTHTIPLLAQNTSHLDEPEEPVDGDTLPLLLIIEDNLDVVELLSDLLRGVYRIDFAYNGEAGIEKAFAEIPDIIISDVMMPLKDGFEVVEALTNDIRTSHIPIVLLTAKVMVEDRIAGLKRGADAYLSKPFHHAELMATLGSLLDKRARLQARYALVARQEVGIDPSTEKDRREAAPIGDKQAAAAQPKNSWQDGVLQSEDDFLRQLQVYVAERLTDGDLSVEQVCQAMGISQSALYRKLTALTGQSLAPFIRSMRLQKAKTLLLTTSKPVSDIAFETGFSNPRFFSTVFHQEFGLRPRDFRNNAGTA